MTYSETSSAPCAERMSSCLKLVSVRVFAYACKPFSQDFFPCSRFIKAMIQPLEQPNQSLRSFHFVISELILWSRLLIHKPLYFSLLLWLQHAPHDAMVVINLAWWLDTAVFYCNKKWKVWMFLKPVRFLMMFSLSNSVATCVKSKQTHLCVIRYKNLKHLLLKRLNIV